jgi:hypothetical protein
VENKVAAYLYPLTGIDNELVAIEAAQPLKNLMNPTLTPHHLQHVNDFCLAGGVKRVAVLLRHSTHLQARPCILCDPR